MATNYLDKTGLGELWGKIKALSDVVIVTVTGSSADGVVTYTADKTYAELKTARIEGKMVILRYASYHFYLWVGPINASGTVDFTFGTLECGNTYYFTISKDDVVERKDLKSVRTVNGRTGNVTLTYSDVGALPDSTVIPTKVSDLNNDSGFQTQAQVESAINSARTMVVHITWDSTNSKYVSDKTFAEIYNAFNNDTNIIAICDSSVYDLIGCYYYSEYGEGLAKFCQSYINNADGEVFVEGNCIDILVENGNLEGITTVVTYNANTFIPANVSDLNNDVGYQTQAQVNALISAVGDDDTTYTISMSGNVITLTGSDGNTSTVTLPVYTGGVV